MGMANVPGKGCERSGHGAARDGADARAAERDRRRATALRENLRRRKRQQRLKAQGAAPPAGDSSG